MSRLVVICVLIFGLPAPILSYPYIDSLLIAYDISESESEQLVILAEISEYLRSRDPDTALYYANRFLDLAEELGDEPRTAQANFVLGVCHQKLGLITPCIENLNTSRAIYEELADSFGVARVLNTFGNLWNTEGNFNQALEYYNKSQEIFEALGMINYLSSIYLNIGTAHDGMGDYDQALYFYFRSLEQFERMMEAGDTTQAIISAYLNIGDSYISKELPDQAYGFYQQALGLGKKMQVRPRLSDTYGHLGNYYNFIGDYDQAILYFDSSLSIAEEDHLIYNIKNNAESLSHTYEMTGDYNQALHYSKLYNLIYDSIVTMEAREKLVTLEWQRKIEEEVQKSEEEMRIMRLKGRFTFLALVLVIISLFYIYRNYRIKKKANAILAEVDQLKSRMFSNISHELRSPLTLLMDPLEQMLDEGQQKKISIKTAKLMHRNARRLLDLVNQMLDLSKLDEGKLKIEICKAGLVHHLKLTALAFTSLAEKNVIHYNMRFPEKEIEAYFDPDKLEVILANLLSNAFKYTPVGGSVSLSVSVNREPPLKMKNHFDVEWLHISIHDSGQGIPETELPKIFNRFYQVGGSDDPDRVGTGIGLSLTKELVDLLGGEIRVESKLQHGTHFLISLPLGFSHLKESDYVIVEDPASGRKDMASFEGDEGPSIYAAEKEDLPIVLTVEDSGDIRSHIRDSLVDYNVLEAPDGELGLERAIEVLPDLVITDLRMPRMDGVELCKKLKTDERTSHIPVIMLTAKIDVKSRIEGLETGADDYLTKPFNIKELKARIRNLIEQRKKLQEHYSKNIMLETGERPVASSDERFLNHVMGVIEKNLSDPEFSVEQLCNELTMSRMQTFRKIKALTDQSPSEFIRTIRLKRSAYLIKNNFGNLAEITYEVGFSNPSYFAKCFREQYGVSPSEYAKE
jgi:signal transduction histidine kinase/DNA-binding response OmpR family regulator